MKKKQIAILGSTGSIGTQALEVIEENPSLFEVYALTANNNATLLIEQAKKFQPEMVVVANEAKYQEVKDALADMPIKVFAGSQSIADVVESEPIDIVLTAMVGYAGLYPTIKAIKAHKTIALANKETLVVAGDLICRLAEENKVAILPVDSEHSAVFQCLAGELSPIEKILLTASGGPFRGKDRAFLEHVTPADALKHPNWSMGAKITIDSASMMNKGFEVIEAKWLFNVKASQIEAVVHPQSLIHSMVQFQDGSIKAQLGLPDMKLPIQYAFGYPTRLKNNYPRLDFFTHQTMTFEKPDLNVFRNLAFAYAAMDKGGNMPCILNAVSLFTKSFVATAALGESDIGIFCNISTQGFIRLASKDKQSYVDCTLRINESTFLTTEVPFFEFFSISILFVFYFIGKNKTIFYEKQRKD